jgi:leader peptidase (prepilin peptidase) / N-methyltransferase
MPCAPIITLHDLPPVYTYAYWGFLGVVGAIVGSFLNVVALRQLNDEEFVKTPSHCYSCDARIKWYDNIPILSWLILGGKCRNCQAGIHWQYPVVEAATAALFVGAGHYFGPTVVLLPVLAMIASFVVMTITDFRERVIFTFNALWLVPLGLLVHALGLDNNLLTALAWVPQWTMETGTLLDASFWSALFGVIGVFVVFEGLIWASRALAGREAFGHGDTLILMAVSAFMGWEYTLFTLVLGGLLTGVISLPMMFHRWMKNGHWELAARLGGALLATGGMFALTRMPQTDATDKAVFLASSGLILAVTLWLLFGFLRKLRETNAFTEAPFGPGLMLAALMLLFYGKAYMPDVYNTVGPILMGIGQLPAAVMGQMGAAFH